MIRYLADDILDGIGTCESLGIRFSMTRQSRDEILNLFVQQCVIQSIVELAHLLRHSLYRFGTLWGDPGTGVTKPASNQHEECNLDCIP